MAAAVTALFRAVGHQGVVTASNRVSASMKAVGTAHVQTTGKIAKFRAEVSRSLAVSSRFAKMHGTTIPGQLRVFVAHLHRTSPAVQRFATTTRAAFASIRAGIDEVVVGIPFLGAALARLGPKGAAAALGLAALAGGIGVGAAVGAGAAAAADVPGRLRERYERFGGAPDDVASLIPELRKLADETGQNLGAVQAMATDIVTMGTARGQVVDVMRGIAAAAGAAQQPIADYAQFINMFDVAEQMGGVVDTRTLRAAARGTELLDILKEQGIAAHRLMPDYEGQLQVSEIQTALANYGRSAQGRIDIENAGDDFTAARNRVMNQAMIEFAQAGKKLAPSMVILADALRAVMPILEPLILASTAPLRMVGGILGWGQRTFNNDSPATPPPGPREEMRRHNARAAMDGARGL